MDRIELVATVIMAVAAIFTAWAAFESAKWSGIQATSFSQAGAARTESTRFDTLGGQQTGLDVALFISFVTAVNNDSTDGVIEFDRDTPFVPTEGTLSGFLYERARPEFKPALDAWLVEFATLGDNAPATPFQMDEYVVANRVTAEEFLLDAQQKAEDAARANQNSDDYVLTVVAFALVLFFGGVSSKLNAERNQLLALGVAVVLFVGATIALFSLPKIWPF
jgi:hypothetical protein